MTIPREQIILKFMTTLIATGKYLSYEIKDLAVKLADEYEKAIMVPEGQVVPEKQEKLKDPKFLIGQNVLVISSKFRGTIIGIRFSTVSGEVEYSVNFNSVKFSNELDYSIPANFTWLPENDLIVIKFNEGQKINFEFPDRYVYGIGTVKRFVIDYKTMTMKYYVKFQHIVEPLTKLCNEDELRAVEDLVQPDKTTLNLPKKEIVLEKQEKLRDPNFLIGQNVWVVDDKLRGIITGIRFTIESDRFDYSVNHGGHHDYWYSENKLVVIKFNTGQKVRAKHSYKEPGIIKWNKFNDETMKTEYFVEFPKLEITALLDENELSVVEDVVQPDKTTSNFSRGQKVLFNDGGTYKTGRIVRVTCSQRDFKVTLCQVEDHFGERYLVSPDKLTQIKFFVGEPVKHKKSGNFGIIKQVKLNNETMEIEYIIRFVTGDCMYGENDLLSIDES